MDDTIDEAAADVTAYLKDGQKLHVRVERAIGSFENPMTDKHLEAKFEGLSNPILGQSQTRQLIQTCWDLKNQPHLEQLLKLATKSSL